MIKKRTTASGTRYDVRFRGPDGRERSRSFRTRRDAERYERDQRTALDRGNWIDPRHAGLTFDDYADRWLSERHELRPRTVELYGSLLRCHIAPKFGPLALGKISPAAVRSWNAKLAQAHEVTAAKAYRLLNQILATAVADELIGRNPCVVRGAGQEHSPERPMVSIAEVDALAAAMPADMRVAVTLAAWCQLRRAELLGLERRDVDLLHGTVRIERAANHVPGGLQLGPPKTAAGVRTVSIPPHILGTLEDHLAANVAPEATAPVLTGPAGARLRPSTLQNAWKSAREAIGRPKLHFHDLRGAGLTWAATQGATTKELMARAGHASPDAALRYQHATEDRDAAIAFALSALAQTPPVVPISSGARNIRGMNRPATRRATAK
jgi:integrase